MRPALPDQAVPQIIVIPVTQFTDKWRTVQKSVNIRLLHAGLFRDLPGLDSVMAADGRIDSYLLCVMHKSPALPTAGHRISLRFPGTLFQEHKEQWEQEHHIKDLYEAGYHGAGSSPYLFF